ncbi:hypothetical protein B2J88_14600 [Rhodococcus sp. SRB_17]|uniref:hypothetical protein n=1 Tax=Rhodococcus sp. OK302 TaxID=1882769 RepID=UPI000B93F505|nr:hypothetical protein [Rhodococcus sp. OK302]NMM85585.1 hypothetical protein [Rhodococcus sp. SRB_17]OYD70208.1 hypothetical protein BDB13_3805 [Rhodococcus sp. OK302]
MSRLPGKKLARRIPTALVGAAAVVALTAGSTMISAGTAGAEPAAPFDLGALIAQATAISPDATTAIQQLIGKAAVDQITDALGLPAIAKTETQNFMYPAPTLGCGLDGQMATVTLSTAQAGPNFPLPAIKDDQLRFQALPAYLAIPKTSGLSVAWLNTTTFKSGIVPLDDSIPILGTPMLSKVVDTGNGKVLASIFGKVDYTDGKSCTVLPTVGTFDA